MGKCRGALAHLGEVDEETSDLTRTAASPGRSRRFLRPNLEGLSGQYSGLFCAFSIKLINDKTELGVDKSGSAREFETRSSRSVSERTLLSSLAGSAPARWAKLR